MTDSLLETSHLHKHFGGIFATEDVNLQVKAGDIHAIIGPNGAGKTTLLAQLSGQLKSDSGSISFAGEDITHLSMDKRAHRGLARSFQITSIILPMTLLENVKLAVQATEGHSFRFWKPVSGDSAMTEQAMQVLTKVGLSDKASQLASQVSHGEQRQLEVAMALAMKPRMLLLDEPMAGMGKDETSRMIDLLAQLKGEKTLLLVEHDMDAVFNLADQLSVLVDGHIIATDTVAAIRDNVDVQKAYLGESHA